MAAALLSESPEMLCYVSFLLPVVNLFKKRGNTEQNSSKTFLVFVILPSTFVH